MPGATLITTLQDFASLCDRKAEELAGLDFSGPLNVLAVLMGAESKERFATATAPDGSPWLPLKRPRTVSRRVKARRKKTGETDQILRDTGLLMASVTGQGRGHVGSVTAHELVWGTNVSYASYQQDGTRHIPPRPFLGWSPELLTKADEVLADWLASKVVP